MTKVEELQEKVTNAAAKVEKCSATIQRHEQQLEKNIQALVKQGVDTNNLKGAKWNPAGGGSEFYWAICAVEGKQRDILNATKKLREAEEILNNWKTKLNLEMEKDRFLNDNAPEVIKEFLAKWKAQAYEWHIRTYARYIETKEALRIEQGEAKSAFLTESGLTYVHFMDKKLDAYLKECELRDKDIKAKLAMFGGVILTMDTYRYDNERLAWLEKTLEAERRAKMLDLIYRVNDVDIGYAPGKDTDGSCPLSAISLSNLFISISSPYIRKQVCGSGNIEYYNHLLQLSLH